MILRKSDEAMASSASVVATAMMVGCILISFYLVMIISSDLASLRVSSSLFFLRLYTTINKLDKNILNVQI